MVLAHGLAGTSIPFAAVLLAGGQSRRMGRDKALLPLPDGRLLWQRQLALLKELEPSAVFLAGPPRPGFPASLRQIDDETPGLGPLGGIVAALRATSAPLLVVLAVDLPAMTAGFLRTLLAEATARTGVVPRQPETGFYEPLAAVYPTSCLPLAEQTLQQPDRSLQTFLRHTGEIIRPHDITPGERMLFTNWNAPGSLLQ